MRQPDLNVQIHITLIHYDGPFKKYVSDQRGERGSEVVTITDKGGKGGHAIIAIFAIIADNH